MNQWARLIPGQNIQNLPERGQATSAAVKGMTTGCLGKSLVHKHYVLGIPDWILGSLLQQNGYLALKNEGSTTNNSHQTNLLITTRVKDQIFTNPPNIPDG